MERCQDCGRDVQCVRQKNAGEISFAVINRVSYSTGSYRRSEVLVNFDSLQAVSAILHLREIFGSTFNEGYILRKLFGVGGWGVGLALGLKKN